MRRAVAQYTRQRTGHLWPVNPVASATPEGWPGWPEGKKFAIVLTHDVEGPDGLEKTPRLAKLELSLGFRSSFNFIPEGGYSTPSSVRDWLIDQGFEVGVHDLHHDGRLYDSASDFGRKAQRINRHLKEWKAVGFRSGFMLNRLEWLHELDIEYDASTFDTDPFEPQPAGTNTIFPFWISSPDGKNGHGSARQNQKNGYVELPYTLPQDSTLFLVLKEKSDEIWRRKLDWVASHGGMVLVNVHPDYLDFRAERSAGAPCVFDHYASLLNYINAKYSGMYWHPLPKDVAAFVKTNKQLLVSA